MLTQFILQQKCKKLVGILQCTTEVKVNTGNNKKM